VVGPVLVDAGAEAGRAELKGHRAGQSFAPLAKSRSTLSRRPGTRKRSDRAQFGAARSS
jgi:hypothetical protein